MQPDYPAAHSMDTEWFAVDKHGNVALCKSGEPGPKPVAVPHQSEAIFRVLPRLFLARPQMILNQHLVNEKSMLIWVCMLVPASLDVASVASPHIEGEPIETEHGILRPIYFDDVDAEDYRQLHADGSCRGCVSWWDDWAQAATRVGLFYYDAEDNYHNGPYLRRGTPTRPIRAEELPIAPADTNSVAIFPDVDFAHAPTLQPLEHMPCDTWGTSEGGTYLASDLKTVRALPPRPPKNRRT